MIWRNLLVCFLAFLSSCAPRQPLISDLGVKKKCIPMCLEIPKNNLVFENVSPVLHEVFYSHFLRVGYILVDQQKQGYTLCTEVKNISPRNKFVSPDVILVHTTIRIELSCKLLNFRQEVVAQKSFFLSTLISKPRNPILSSDFNDYEYRRLFERSASQVERFFRPYMLDC